MTYISPKRREPSFVWRRDVADRPEPGWVALMAKTGPHQVSLPVGED